uniref:Ras association domain family member 11 n=1 Tax=Salarias fasciatus TaxID=181472 RepID=A0A672J9H8_SALFA
MEVKVSVDGIPRVVCGVTRETTCQEVVLALAQALGQPGRYNLREKFKEFERCMTPDERLLETLERYGEQAKEVQLILMRRGSSSLTLSAHSKQVRFGFGPFLLVQFVLPCTLEEVPAILKNTYMRYLYDLRFSGS